MQKTRWRKLKTAKLSWFHIISFLVLYDSKGTIWNGLAIYSGSNIYFFNYFIFCLSYTLFVLGSLQNHVLPILIVFVYRSHGNTNFNQFPIACLIFISIWWGSLLESWLKMPGILVAKLRCAEGVRTESHTLGNVVTHWAKKTFWYSSDRPYVQHLQSACAILAPYLETT